MPEKSHSQSWFEPPPPPRLKEEAVPDQQEERLPTLSRNPFETIPGLRPIFEASMRSAVVNSWAGLKEYELAKVELSPVLFASPDDPVRFSFLQEKIAYQAAFIGSKNVAMRSEAERKQEFFKIALEALKKLHQVRKTIASLEHQQIFVLAIAIEKAEEALGIKKPSHRFDEIIRQLHPMPIPDQEFTVTTLPTCSVLEERLQTLTHDLAKKKKHAVFYKELESVFLHHRAVMAKIRAPIEETEQHKVTLSRVAEHLQAIVDRGDHVLNFERELNRAYKQLVKEYHPDRVTQKGDPSLTKEEAEERFLELERAHRVLSEGPAELRERLALEYLFGQRFDAWTPEMIVTAKACLDHPWLLEMLMRTQPSRAPTKTDACKSCDGRGTHVIRDPDDYFPVPRICAACEGHGEVREKIEVVLKSKKKKS